MEIILYNPLSSKGKNEKRANKLRIKLVKKGKEVITKNLIEIQNVQVFLNNLNIDDKIIILGGDGTLHRIINTIDASEIEQEIYMYKGGSGNDFLRSLPKRAKFIQINQYLKEFPIATISSEETKVLNGIGVGLDGMVAHRVNLSKALKNRSNYFKNAIISFLKFKPIQARFVVDGLEFEEKKVWFATTMYGSCFGGGMKIAAGKKRNDGRVELVIVRNVSKLGLLIIFPTIYLGLHKKFKRLVKTIEARQVEVYFKTPTYLQIDGETQYPVDHYQVKS